jgi:hypothetical protein
MEPAVSSRRREIALFATLVALGIALYAARWFVFPGPALHNEMWRFLLGDLAFLFIQVALVTLVIDGLLRNRERQAMRRKLNMVIGAFFSELGTELLGRLAEGDTSLSQVRGELIPSSSWTAAHYAAAKRIVAAHNATVDITACNLEGLKAMLIREKSFVLGMLSNQTLLEHEEFTELLWSVTHLAEELEARTSMHDIPTADAAHLAGDLKRAYAHLTREWLGYLEHLQTAYPFLFSLAVRTNPLDPSARAEVR